MWPWVIPISNDLAASSDGGSLCGNSAILVTAHIGDCRVLNGVVAIPFTLDGGLSSGAIVRGEAFVPCASELIPQNTTMGGSGAGEGQTGNSGRDELHVSCNPW